MSRSSVLYGAFLLASIAAPLTAQTSSAVPVQQPAAKGTMSTARELVALLDLDQQYDFIFNSLGSVFAQATLNEARKNPAAKQKIDTLIEKGEGGSPRLEKILSEEFRTAIRKQYPAMKEATAKEYADAFSEAELRDLIAFYKSASGAKSLRVVPELQQKLARAGGAAGMAAGMEAGRRAFERAEREMLPAKTNLRS